MNTNSVFKNNLEPFIIAETAFSHEGSFDYLKDLILNLKNERNIGIKFQILINKDDFLTESNPIYSDIDKWLLNRNQWEEAIDIAYNNNVKVILAVLDNEAIEIAKAKKNMISAIEIHPSCIPDTELLNNAINLCNMLNIPLILGVSGFNFKEIDYLVDTHLKEYDTTNLIFMYGFQNYPTKLDSINLNRMKIYQEKYRIKVGYADHTEFNNNLKDNIISMVYGMGINVLELHYVKDYGKDRIDYITAYDANRIIMLRDKLESLNMAKGKYEESMSDSEKEYSVKFRKIPVYNGDFEKGYNLETKDICFKRSNRNSDFLIFESDKIVGMKTTEFKLKNQPILKEELE